MDLPTLIETHGYWLLVLGCTIEGETALVLAGFAAWRGYLDWRAVILIATTVSFSIEMVLFWLGRRHGAAMATRFPAIGRQARRIHRLIDRYPNLSIIGVRFAYGLRTAGPILIGGSTVSTTRFFALSLVGTAAWAIGFVAIGWVFGEAATAILREVMQVEGSLLAALAVGGLALALLRAVRHRRRRAG
ncbi:MAG: DedA family protein [Lautropia sp.]